MTSRVVCGFGVPHVPVFPDLARRGDEDVAGRYARVAKELSAADPSLLVVVANDHLNTYFLDRLPTFALGMCDTISGPIDDVAGVELRPLPTDRPTAELLAASLVELGVDLLMCRDADVDHSVVVPLHFLNPNLIAAVVLHVNGFVPPLPTASRCYEVGRVLATAVSRLPGQHRVAVIASGSFSQEVGGHRVDPGRTWSVPRPDWAAVVSDALAHGRHELLIEQTTPSMLAAAGSVAGELLSWITMIGAVDAHLGRVSPVIDHRSGEAFAFGSWMA